MKLYMLILPMLFVIGLAAAQALPGESSAALLTPLSHLRGPNAKLTAFVNSEDSSLKFHIALSSVNPSDRLWAVDSLSAFRDGMACNALVSALRDDDATVREKAATSLAKWQAGMVIPKVVSVLNDEHPEVRAAALITLTDLYTQPVDHWDTPAILQGTADTAVWEQTAIPKIGELLQKETDPSMQLLGAAVLGTMENAASVPYLTPYITADGPLQRMAAYGLAQSGFEGVRTLTACLQQNTFKDVEARINVIHALGNIAPTAETNNEAVTVLCRELSDGNPSIAIEAARALAECGTRNLHAQDELITRWKSLSFFAPHQASTVRSALLQAMGAQQQPGPQCLDIYTACIADQQEPVELRLDAVSALCQAREQGKSALKKVLDGHERDLQDRALIEMQLMGPDASFAIDDIFRIAENTNLALELRGEAIRAIARIGVYVLGTEERLTSLEKDGQVSGAATAAKLDMLNGREMKAAEKGKKYDECYYRKEECKAEKLTKTVAYLPQTMISYAIDLPLLVNRTHPPEKVITPTGIAKRMSRALEDSCGYYGHYAIPHGFVLVGKPEAFYGERNDRRYAKPLPKDQQPYIPASARRITRFLDICKTFFLGNQMDVRIMVLVVAEEIRKSSDINAGVIPLKVFGNNELDGYMKAFEHLNDSFPSIDLGAPLDENQQKAELKCTLFVYQFHHVGALWQPPTSDTKIEAEIHYEASGLREKLEGR